MHLSCAPDISHHYDRVLLSCHSTLGQGRTGKPGGGWLGGRLIKARKKSKSVSHEGWKTRDGRNGRLGAEETLSFKIKELVKGPCTFELSV